jgi:gliding motility-associated-like protein
VTYTFSDYCPAADSEDIEVLEDADASVEPLASLCISDSAVQLIAADTTGVWSGNGITDADEGIFDPSEAGGGLWEINYIINSVCGDQSSVTIEVLDPSSPISQVSPLCENEGTITLSTAQEGGEWSGTGITNSSEGLFSPATTGVGTHLITYTLTLQEGCSSTQQIEIIVNPLPEVDFSPDQLEGCMPFTVTFENLAASSGSCDWDFGDGTSVIDCGPTVSHTYTSPGVYSPSLTVLDENGCANTQAYEDLITVFNLPVASFTCTPDYPSTLDGYLELTDQSVGGITEYEWEGIDGVFSTEQNPEYTFDELGIHYITLYVTDSNGCRDSTVHAVEVEDELHVYIPNAITLNWDGTNDVLIPVISGADRAEFEFQIYDRWGAIMYESTDLENTVWLGGVDKSMVPPGVYTWKLKLRSSATKVIHKMTGHVTVIR